MLSNGNYRFYPGPSRLPGRVNARATALLQPSAPTARFTVPQPSGGRPIEGEVAVRQERDARVVAVTGPLDLDSVAPLEEVLRKAAEDGVAPVVVDLSAATFADSTTVNVLLQAHDALGPALRLAAPSAVLMRLFTLTGLDTVLPLYDSVPKALDAEPAAPLGADGGDREG
ncbi:STAS domain-containing protein [Streptomyces platensis]|nr:STAS domain-containing protein [Streptomyces platensis]